MREMMRDRGYGVYTKMVQSRFHVRAPYNEEFVLVAHELEGRWKKRSEVWSFDRDRYYRVAKEVNRIYGTHLPEDPLSG